MTAPTITPAEAKKLFGDDLGQEVFHGEYRITMDGPMMSPSSIWAPVVELPNGDCYFVEGEPGDPMEGRGWVGPY